MLTKHSILLPIFVWILSPMAFAADANRDAILVRFNYNDGQWQAPRDEFFRAGLDLEADQDKDGKLLTIRFDLNGDDVPEYFLRTLCGNGGCEYPIFDGKTNDYLGNIFGSEVWLLRRRSHGLPVIEAFGHLSASISTIARYEFNGSKYEEVSSREIGNEETQLLYKRLERMPRVKVK